MSTILTEPTDEQLKKYYDVALNLVLKCGTIFREGYDTVHPSYEVKSAFYDFVTVYDKQIESVLISGLKKEFPESQFIGEEESAASKRKLELINAPTWIIDPIDGTTNFIHKIPQCCISVGLAINRQLVVGIIYSPIENHMYSAWKGHGAYLNGERIHVSKCTKISSAVIGYEITLINVPQIRDKHVKRFYKLTSYCTGARGYASAAVTLAYVARGSLDCYHVEDLQPWDIAAGAVILTEAGGVLKNTTGAAFDVMKPNLICASTEDLFKNVKQLIDEADQLTDFEFK